MKKKIKIFNHTLILFKLKFLKQEEVFFVCTLLPLIPHLQTHHPQKQPAACLATIICRMLLPSRML